MESSSKALREKLNSGGFATGTAIYSASANMVEAAGYAGIDFLRIDTEHTWRQDESLESMIRGATIAGTVAFVRVDRENPYLIRKALELGAGGVIVPHVFTAAYAKEVVQAAKFPPIGTRGFGNLCSSGKWGAAPAAEWIAHSNANSMVGVMIESAAAIDEIDDIMAVEGLDFALFGAADYSMSVGLNSPQQQHPIVEDGLVKTIEAARKCGKHVMLGVGPDDNNVKQYYDMGVTMFEFGHDVTIFQHVLKKRINLLQSITSH